MVLQVLLNIITKWFYTI